VSEAAMYGPLLKGTAVLVRATLHSLPCEGARTEKLALVDDSDSIADAV